MTTLDKRIENLEAVKDDRPLEPMVIYCHGWPEDRCKETEKGNRMVVIRPYPGEVHE